MSSLPWMVARTHLAICASQNSVIQDRSIYEDAHIFARALRDMKILSLRDDRAYRELYNLIIETLPPPDLLVYLQASVPTLMERIGKQGGEASSRASRPMTWSGLAPSALSGSKALTCVQC